LLLPVPPTLSEQQDIVELLETIDQKISLHNKKKEILEELFQTVLYKLMTGQLLVNDLGQSALMIPPTIEAMA
jgi:type I restriction enzyme, S subunit